MKLLGLGILAFVFMVCGGTLPVSAVIESAPSDGYSVKINGPLLITGYSFSGHTINYVQIYNGSSSVVSLENWRLAYDYNSTSHDAARLSGLLAPKQYVTVAREAILPNATFFIDDTVAPTDPVLSTIRLIPPAELLFNDEVSTPAITSSTPRVAGVPATFYFARAISATTGNFNTGFSAFVPSTDFVLLSDSLYAPPANARISIVEIYPDAPSCSPNGTALCQDYVKIFNGASDSVDLSKLRLRTGSYGQSSTSTNTVQLSGILASGAYASFPLSLSSSGSWVWLEDAFGLVRYDETIIVYPSSTNNDHAAWSYDIVSQTWRWTNYPQPGATENQFPQPVNVNACSGLIINEFAANVASEDQYIELLNTNMQTVSVEGCLLQTNRSTIKSHSLSGDMAPGELRTVYVKDTELTLTKTAGGVVYVLSSDGLVEVDAVEYKDLPEDTAFALVDGVWGSTYALTPGARNVLQEYPACDEGYYRNIETGYCNKLATATAQTDCGQGKYRSPETNRCRNIATTGSSLAQCAVHQVRNPSTNRCRALTTVSDLKACNANQERNPITNRCRNKVSMIKADFPVEAVGKTTQATLGWWAFGGVGLLALGYAGWEWRMELLGAIRKASSFIPGRS